MIADRPAKMAFEQRARLTDSTVASSSQELEITTIANDY